MYMRLHIQCAINIDVIVWYLDIISWAYWIYSRMGVPLVDVISALLPNAVGVLRRFGGVAKGVRSNWSTRGSKEVTWSILHLSQKFRVTWNALYGKSAIQILSCSIRRKWTPLQCGIKLILYFCKEIWRSAGRHCRIPETYFHLTGTH